MSLPVLISEWNPAPFELQGESVFAVGDVHGCSAHLSALLQTIAATDTPAENRRRLIYLGDIIDRGPDNIGALKLWAGDESAARVDRVDRVIGNHEIMMLLAMGDGPYARQAAEWWLADTTGGGKVLAEMRAACRDPRAKLSHALAVAALGEDVMRLLITQRSHLRLGNTVFVHGGVDGRADIDAFLSPAWTEFTGAGWAWITRGFLDWQGGFKGTLVVHGHTPPAKHWPLTHMDDPHLFLFDRLGLDGGSAVTGIVTAAEIENGRYRIYKAGIAA